MDFWNISLACIRYFVSLCLILLFGSGPGDERWGPPFSGSLEPCAFVKNSSCISRALDCES